MAVTATAPARTRGLGNPAFVTNASRARLAARSGGTEYPRRRSSAANTTPAKTAPPTSVVRRRKRRRRNSTATTAAIAATATTWSRPVRSSPGTVSGSSPDTVAARERNRRSGITALTTSAATRITPLMIRRITSPGWRYRGGWRGPLTPCAPRSVDGRGGGSATSWACTSPVEGRPSTSVRALTHVGTLPSRARATPGANPPRLAAPSGRAR